MRIGFIGVGNMGGAILEGYGQSEASKKNTISAYDLDKEKLEYFNKEYKVNGMNSIEELVRGSDVIIIGVKPNLYDKILPNVKKAFDKEKVIVSMAAGISIKFIEDYLGADAKIIRIMPNTPAQVKEAMTAVCKKDNIDEDIFSSIMEIFESIGRAQVVGEDLLHTVIGVSGSSPAYTYMYIEALAKSAEAFGMDYNQAVTFAAQSVLGAAKMVLENDKSPKQLREDVCSPGGTTIEAVNTLLENGFEEKVKEGFTAAVEKSKKMTTV